MKIFALIGCLGLLFFPLACSKVYTLQPLSNSSTPTLTPTSTATIPICNGGMVTTLAGSGSAGNTNATGTAASFSGPYGICADSAGNVYVGDNGNDMIRKITPGGVVSTLAGGSQGAVNGIGTAASFSGPDGVAVDTAGNVYVADTGNCMIRKITPAGLVSTLAGAGSPGYINATGTAAAFYAPYGVAVDTSGNVYVADTYNLVIRKITPGGVVTTLAGSGFQGSVNATGTAASFNYPFDVAVDASGNVYVADTFNYLIREITPGGLVTTLAGTGGKGANNGPAATATFFDPRGVAVDSSDDVYVSDNGNNMVRVIVPGAGVFTLAGQLTAGAVNATGTAASFDLPEQIAVDPFCNVYVTDWENQLIRKIH